MALSYLCVGRRLRSGEEAMWWLLHSSVLLSVLLTAAHPFDSELQTWGRGCCLGRGTSRWTSARRILSGLMVTHLPTFLVGSQLAICVSRLC